MPGTTPTRARPSWEDRGYQRRAPTRHPDALAPSDEAHARSWKKAGYDYDASLGYNETIGYLNGTTQVFRPSVFGRCWSSPCTSRMAPCSFQPNSDLSESDAWTRCEELIGAPERWAAC